MCHRHHRSCVTCLSATGGIYFIVCSKSGGSFISSSLRFKGPVRLAKHSPGRIIKSCHRVPEQPIVASRSQQHLCLCARMCERMCACLLTADLPACRNARVSSRKMCAQRFLCTCMQAHHRVTLAPVGPFQSLSGVVASPARLISHVTLVNKSPLWRPGRLTDSISPPAIGSRLSHCIIARGLSFYTPLIAFISRSRSTA